MSRIIVGVDESAGSADAITLASSLARMIGATVTLVNVFPYDATPSRAVNSTYEAYLRRDSLAMLERLRSEHGDESFDVEAIANPSAPHGLHALAEAADAGLIVVGSTHTGHAGRVLPGSTAERLLHGSPCPVAMAPKGYAERGARQPGIVGCGYDGSLSAQRALRAAHRIAAATGARLRVIRAFHRPAPELPVKGVPMGGLPYADKLQEQAEKELDGALVRLDGEPRGEAFFAVGDPAAILAESSEQLDLLVVGSRGYGPMHSVMVGGVAGRVVREAACPVIVFPRSAGHTAEDSVFAKAVSLHG